MLASTLLALLPLLLSTAGCATRVSESLEASANSKPLGDLAQALKGSLQGRHARSKPCDVDKDQTPQESTGHSNGQHSEPEPAREGCCSAKESPLGPSSPEEPVSGSAASLSIPPVRGSDFAVKGVLGKGSGSIVYRVASVHGAGSFLALKVIPKAQSSANACSPDLWAAMIANEITIMKVLSKLPHFLLLQTFFMDEDHVYILMECMEGGSLKELLDDFDLRLELIQLYSQQLVSGLILLHGHGIMHRDMKPANIYLTADRKTVKICDFGLASMETTSRHLCGTFYYWAPELAQSMEYSCAIDVWALGVIVFQMVTSTFPFNPSPDSQGSRNVVRTLLLTVIDGKYDEAPLPNVASLRAFIAAMLETQPDRRIAAKDLLAHPFLSEQLPPIDYNFPVIDKPEAANDAPSGAGIKKSPNRMTEQDRIGFDQVLQARLPELRL